MQVQEKDTISFIGAGVMGRSMAAHLLRAGYTVQVYTRTKEKAEELIRQGAAWCPTVAEAAATAKVVITMVGYPHDVEEVYLGPSGIIAQAPAGAYLIDMTTSSPKLAQRIYEEASRRNLHALDAPVSGGDIGAREARLTIMAGGDESDFEAVRPLLALMGSNVILQGSAGAGQYTKMCNQIAIASNMVGVCEALIYASKSGLDPERVLQSIAAGAAGSWSLSNLAPRILEQQYAPGFYIKHFIKDMTIALQSARELGLRMPGLELARELYTELAQSGFGDDGTQALYKWYEQGKTGSP